MEWDNRLSGALRAFCAFAYLDVRRRRFKLDLETSALRLPFPTREARSGIQRKIGFPALALNWSGLAARRE